MLLRRPSALLLLQQLRRLLWQRSSGITPRAWLLHPALCMPLVLVPAVTVLPHICSSLPPAAVPCAGCQGACVDRRGWQRGRLLIFLPPNSAGCWRAAVAEQQAANHIIHQVVQQGPSHAACQAAHMGRAKTEWMCDAWGESRRCAACFSVPRHHVTKPALLTCPPQFQSAAWPSRCWLPTAAGWAALACTR